MERLIKNSNLKISFFLIIILIVFSFGCENDKKKPNSIVNIENNKNVEKNEKDWMNLEKDVFECIELINKSDKLNRKELLKEFVTYANEVDGAIAEGYCGFAFDYPIENSINFFSVLEKTDTILVEKWAEAGALEYMLILNNINSPKEFKKKIRTDFKKSINSFDTSNKKLAEHYFNKLMEISNENGIITAKDKIISENVFLSDFLPESELSDVNVLEKYLKYDFTNIWLNSKSSSVLGTIGNVNQRIRIKFIEINKNPENAVEYIIKGKSMVKNNICEFSGIITLQTLLEYEQFNYGVDNDDKGINKQGILIADYEFFENKQQKNSGKFIGKVYSKWYINSNNIVVYDDIESISDSYTNNAFLGKWISYKTKKEKNCSWSDFRVPNGTSDLDIGAAEFSPNEKYFEKGWKDYIKNNDEW